MGPGESSGMKMRLQPTCERPQVSLGLALRYTRSTTWGGNERYQASGAGLTEAACPPCEGEQQWCWEANGSPQTAQAQHPGHVPGSTCPSPPCTGMPQHWFITDSNDEDDFTVAWAGLPFVAQTQCCNVCGIPASFRIWGSAFVHLSSGKLKRKRNTTSSVSIPPTLHPHSRLPRLSNASYWVLKAMGMLLPAVGTFCPLLVFSVPPCFTCSEWHRQGMLTAAFTYWALTRTLYTMTNF